MYYQSTTVHLKQVEMSDFSELQNKIIIEGIE